MAVTNNPHEGFHMNLKYHGRILKDMRRLTENLDYLSPVNREMQIMGSRGSIESAIQTNVKAFKRFSAQVTQAN